MCESNQGGGGGILEEVSSHGGNPPPRVDHLDPLPPRRPLLLRGAPPLPLLVMLLVLLLLMMVVVMVMVVVLRRLLRRELLAGILVGDGVQVRQIARRGSLFVALQSPHRGGHPAPMVAARRRSVEDDVVVHPVLGPRLLIHLRPLRRRERSLGLDVVLGGRGRRRFGGENGGSRKQIQAALLTLLLRRSLPLLAGLLLQLLESINRWRNRIESIKGWNEKQGNNKLREGEGH